MELGLRGKTALVTGASKGIGYAVAERLAAEGCSLILVARTAADLEKAKRQITEKHRVEVRTHAKDLSSGAETLAAEFPDIDIVVNNAGAIPGGKIEDIDDATWRKAWDLKVFGYVNLTRAYYLRMKARGRGVIVNIIGTGGEKPSAGYIVGAAGNASLAINPGAVRTGRMITLHRKQAADKFGDPERWKELIDAMPLRGPSDPEDIAAMAGFLASDLAKAISGTVITIGKGMVNH
jgi:NAD(P)-dependent dehydrogenase (short-subunit alcohol dehydrogenase family)